MKLVAEHFHVTLPSDGSRLCHPQDTAANFRKYLGATNQLRAKEWEVGSVEISYLIGLPQAEDGRLPVTVFILPDATHAFPRANLWRA
jgi:hypothetical protein